MWKAGAVAGEGHQPGSTVGLAPARPRQEAQESIVRLHGDIARYK